jgi:hypothetical protein
MAKGQLPDEIMEWVEGWFSCDYTILHAWYTESKNYLLTIQQYDKLNFVQCKLTKDGYEMKVDTSLRLKEIPENLICSPEVFT